MLEGGAEAQQLDHLLDLLGSVVLSNSSDCWRWDMNGSGEFRVKDVRNLFDDFFLPKDTHPTRWINSEDISHIFLPARWLLLLLALFVDGGTWIGSPSLRRWIGCRGSRTFG
ncbi:hypothetical protein Tco_0797940 [Tanacetum coccineum]